MIKKLFVAFSVLTCSAIASDVKVFMPLEKILTSPLFQEKVGNTIKFTFADTTLPAEAVSLGPISTSRKTSKLGKKDTAACEWVFLSAMIALKEKAILENANAVIGVVSNYKHVEYSSTTNYECHLGGMVVGVALKGTMVKLPK